MFRVGVYGQIKSAFQDIIAPELHTMRGEMRVMNEKSTLGSWLHGIVHILEGDLKNAQGWYRRAEREFPDPATVQDEIAAARLKLRG
jgi:hypothetical protein